MSEDLHEINEELPHKENLKNHKRSHPARRNLQDILPASHSINGLEASLVTQNISAAKTTKNNKPTSSVRNSMQVVALNQNSINPNTARGRLNQLVEDSDPLIRDLAQSVVLSNNEQFVKKLINEFET